MKLSATVKGLTLSMLLVAAWSPTLSFAGDDSLYRAWGGKAGIRAVMDDFVPRLKSDARIGSFFRDTNAQHLAGQLTDQLCQLAGGPCVYDGPDMKSAHEDMGVRRSDFHALVEILQASMAARGIPFAEQNRMLALLAPMHRDVVSSR
ncbi:group I truncated hemoglobin [Inhella crocodyli]|uniref:Group 1 truncated hemoglobin n=1 Tax=Inhella crocodyli TaxID=2499851 RepID=A0A437LAE3_9BURK|nr:group 1 truncated hemoglobin [Inhella crocodyli]RVT82359.1 group 1 truncated hemoglobin [Inhella crocodyli]